MRFAVGHGRSDEDDLQWHVLSAPVSILHGAVLAGAAPRMRKASHAPLARLFLPGARAGCHLSRSLLSLLAGNRQQHLALSFDPLLAFLGLRPGSLLLCA
jgi:hypothetical protein